MVAEVQALDRQQIAVLERPLTEDDFWNLPDDENRYEIIGGELVVSPPPVVDHQNASQYLSVALYHAIEMTGTGWVRTAPIGVRLSPTDIVQPDLVVLSSETSNGPRGKAISDLPAIVVEILSPSNRRNDLVKKRAQYQTFHVPEYWIVDPIKRTVEVLTLDNHEYAVTVADDGIVRSRVFPAIRLVESHIFSGEPFNPATTPSTTG